MHCKEESPLGENNFRTYLPSICTSFSFSIQVTYSPNTVDTTSTDYFNVVAIGNISKAVIKCVGSSKGANMLHISIVVILKVKINEHICRIQNFISKSFVFQGQVYILEQRVLILCRSTWEVWVRRQWIS